MNSHHNEPLPPQIPDALALEVVRTEPLRFLQEQTARYGDIFGYQADQWRAVVVNHPAYVRQVLHADTRAYSKIGTPDLMMLRPMLGDGLMTSEGPAWLVQRRAAQPAFNKKALAPLAPIMVRATERLVDRWLPHVGHTQPIDVTDGLSSLTLYIVARCLFGADLADQYTDFGAAVGVLNEFMSHFDPTNHQGIRQFHEALSMLQRTVDAIIGVRSTQDPRASDQPDLLDRLITAQDPAAGPATKLSQLRDQIFTILMAGHETTAKALSWTLYLLDQHPEVEERLRQEFEQVLDGKPATAENASSLTFTWQVLQESMRLYPPVWSMTRMCMAGDLIGGYRIEAGTLVVISSYTLHRHPQFWPDPERFDPDRFAPDRAAAQTPYSYLPFSTGARLCIGQPFATLEVVLVLATLLQRLRLRLEPGKAVVPEALVTLRPKDGLPMRLTAV